jgi:signal transduction histidine kinase
MMLKSLTLGAILVLFFYNFFLFISLKSKMYAWYSENMFTAVLFLLVNNGMGHEFIWRECSFMSKSSLGIVYPLLFAAAFQFTRVFLHTKERFPRIDKFLTVLIFFLLSLMLLIFTSFRANIGRLIVSLMFIMALVPLLGIYVWRSGYKEARFYTFAWSIWTIGVIPSLFMFFGANMGYEVIATSVRVAMVGEGILLSFALADQINIIRSQRDEAEAKYESQIEALEIQSRLAQMGEMIAAIGHQWKQPINLIMIYIQEVQYIAKQCGNDTAKQIDTEMVGVKDITELSHLILSKNIQ